MSVDGWRRALHKPALEPRPIVGTLQLGGKQHKRYLIDSAPKDDMILRDCSEGT